MMWPWGTLAYALVAIFATRAVAGHLAWSFSSAQVNRRNYGGNRIPAPRPDAWQWSGAICIALVVAVVWPVAVAWGLAGRFGPAFGEELEAKNRRRSEQLAEREREVARMERELKLGEHADAGS